MQNMPVTGGAFTGPVYGYKETPDHDLELATKKYVDDNAGGGGGGVSNGDKGDITVTGGGTTWTIDNNAVNNAKISDVDASKVTGFDTAVSNVISNTWANLALSPNSITFNSTIGAGDVWNYVYGATTYYRLVPATYDPANDAFYTTFTAGTLSGIITTRA